MPDSTVGAAVLLILAVAIGAAAIWYISRRDRPGRRRSGSLHGMSRDDSVSYFRDLSAESSVPGVQEEDRTGRWGGSSDQPR